MAATCSSLNFGRLLTVTGLDRHDGECRLGGVCVQSACVDVGGCLQTTEAASIELNCALSEI